MADAEGHGARWKRLVEFRTGRRRLLQTMGGALLASVLLPKRADGLEPSPPQTPPRFRTGDLQATLTWDTDNTDMDLFLIEPTGNVVAWCSRTGPTARLDVDNTDGLGPESLYVPAGMSADGVYQLYVGYYQGHVATTATIRVTVFDGTSRQKQATITRVLDASDYNEMLHAVGHIEFPGGDIVEQHGTLLDPAPIPDCARTRSR